MRNNIQVYQLFIAVIVVVGSVFSAWVTVNSRLAVLETRQDNYDAGMLEIRSALKDISKGQTDIFVELQNKKNR